MCSHVRLTRRLRNLNAVRPPRVWRRSSFSRSRASVLLFVQHKASFKHGRRTSALRGEINCIHRKADHTKRISSMRPEHRQPVRHHEHPEEELSPRLTIMSTTKRTKNITPGLITLFQQQQRQNMQSNLSGMYSNAGSISSGPSIRFF